MAPVVSPVTAPVGGASPYPTEPVSVWISTTMSSTLLTVRSAVLKGVRRGTEIRPSFTCVIFILFPTNPIYSAACRVPARRSMAAANILALSRRRSTSMNSSGLCSRTSSPGKRGPKARMLGSILA